MKHGKTDGLLLGLALWLLAFGVSAVRAQTTSVIAWGGNYYRQLNVPTGLTNPKAIAAGYGHTVVLKSDDTVVAWGFNGDGQCNVPAGLANVKAIAAGYSHTVALKSDGTVIAWGRNNEGQCSVPSGLNGVTAIAAGAVFTVALKLNGTVVAWGDNTSGQCNVPAGLNNVKALATGFAFTIALKTNGTVVGWGSNDHSQYSTFNQLSNVNAIAAGSDHSLFTSTGIFGAGGLNDSGQCNIPASLSGKQITAIAAGWLQSAAIESDGALVMWGENSQGQCNVPAGLGSVKAVVMSWYATTAIVTTPISDLYVAGSFGSDSTGDGSASNPYQTVTKALAMAPTSHLVTIHINTGNYGSDKPRITKNIRLVNWTSYGLVQIGKP